MITLTKPQRKAVNNVFLQYSHPDNKPVVVDPYRVFRKRVQPMLFGEGAIVLQPIEQGMFLAIETDGYTHS